MERRDHITLRHQHRRLHILVSDVNDSLYYQMTVADSDSSDPASPHCATITNALDDQWAHYCAQTRLWLTTEYLNPVTGSQVNGYLRSAPITATTALPAAMTTTSTSKSVRSTSDEACASGDSVPEHTSVATVSLLNSASEVAPTAADTVRTDGERENERGSLRGTVAGIISGVAGGALAVAAVVWILRRRLGAYFSLSQIRLRIHPSYEKDDISCLSSPGNAHTISQDGKSAPDGDQRSPDSFAYSSDKGWQTLPVPGHGQVIEGIRTSTRSGFTVVNPDPPFATDEASVIDLTAFRSVFRESLV